MPKDTRFKFPTKKEIAVDPTLYKPLNNLNENFKSTFKQAGQTVFGKNKFSAIDQHWNLPSKKLVPGPGNYDHYSEFTGKVSK